MAEEARGVAVAGDDPQLPVDDRGDRALAIALLADEARQHIGAQARAQHPAHHAVAEHRHRHADGALAGEAAVVDVRDRRLPGPSRLEQVRHVDPRRRLRAERQRRIDQHDALGIGDDDVVPAVVACDQRARIGVELGETAGLERRELGEPLQLAHRARDLAVECDRERGGDLLQVTAGIVAAVLPDQLQQPQREREQGQRRQRREGDEQRLQADGSGSARRHSWIRGGRP
jgi:hypothetical protein